jgi:putative transcriptional regulator
MNEHEIALQDTYESLLLSYAAGLLDQAQSLIVASHIALSPRAKEKVEQCEALGGALMERYCEPVPMKKQSLDNVLNRLDSKDVAVQHEEMYELVFPEGLSIPLCLKRSVACHVQQIHWKKMRPGVERFELSLECRQSKTNFLKAQRGIEAPRLAPRAMELTLVLDGALHDRAGTHKVGDLIIIDEDCSHLGTSCQRNGGFYMVVTSRPQRMQGGLLQLMQALLRH